MAADRRPNILFLFPDQHRHDFVGMNPDLPVRTPNLNALTERGVWLPQAVCPSPLCAPSRACLAAGRRYHRCRVPSNQVDYPLDQPTYYTALRDSGYTVAGVGKFDLHKNTLDWGLDGSRLLGEWGFSEGIDNEGKIDAVRSGAERPMGPYMAYLHERGLAEAHVRDFTTRHGFRDTHPTPLSEDAYCDNWIAENGLRLLKGFPEGRPWHLVLNFTGPHNPMDVTEGMQAQWRDVPFPPPNENDQLDVAHHARIRQNYAAMIENIDRHVGRLLEAVTERGELDRTLVVYSSDHGEMLGDHNRWGKSTYYQPSVGVPLVIAGPGVREGVRSDALVEVQDLTATLLDYARVGPLPDMDSLSLRDILEGRREAHRPCVVSALNLWRMICDGRYKLVLRADGGPLLFDLLQDPQETTNLTERMPGEVERLRGMLNREQRENTAD